MENQALATIASFIAMAFVITSYFLKNKSLYLLFQALCITFLGISYFFSVQFFAMVGLGIALFRALSFFVYEKHDKVAPLSISFFFSGLSVASYFIINLGVLGLANPLDILCLGALVLYAFIFRIRDLKKIRFFMIAPTVLSLLFNALSGAAIFATLTYVFELTANLISIYKYHVRGKIKSNPLKKNVKYKQEKK